MASMGASSLPASRRCCPSPAVSRRALPGRGRALPSLAWGEVSARGSCVRSRCPDTCGWWRWGARRWVARARRRWPSRARASSRGREHGWRSSGTPTAPVRPRARRGRPTTRWPRWATRRSWRPARSRRTAYASSSRLPVRSRSSWRPAEPTCSCSTACCRPRRRARPSLSWPSTPKSPGDARKPCPRAAISARPSPSSSLRRDLVVRVGEGSSDAAVTSRAARTSATPSTRGTPSVPCAWASPALSPVPTPAAFAGPPRHHPVAAAFARGPPPIPARALRSPGRPLARDRQVRPARGRQSAPLATLDHDVVCSSALAARLSVARLDPRRPPAIISKVTSNWGGFRGENSSHSHRAEAPRGRGDGTPKGNDCLVVIYTKEPTLLGQALRPRHEPHPHRARRREPHRPRGDSVSRRHAHLEQRSGAWWCVDDGSTNGTYVNDEQIVREQRLGQRRPHQGRPDDLQVPQRGRTWRRSTTKRSTG
jgi:hypothetical protein